MVTSALTVIAGAVRATSKWEIELGQSYAIAEGTGVGNNLTLTRLGHDFVTEFEISHRSGSCSRRWSGWTSSCREPAAAG